MDTRGRKMTATLTFLLTLLLLLTKQEKLTIFALMTLRNALAKRRKLPSMIMQWIRRSYPYNSWMEQEMWHQSKLSCCSKTTTLLTTICHCTKIKERMPSASFSEKKVCLLHAHASFLMKVSFTVLRHLSVWQHTTNRLNKKSTKWQQYLRIRLFHSMRSCTICKHLLKS